MGLPFISTDKNLRHVAAVLPREAMAIWCDAANTAADLGLERNDCIRAAWDEINKDWHRPVGKRYVRKYSPDQERDDHGRWSSGGGSGGGSNGATIDAGKWIEGHGKGGQSLAIQIDGETITESGTPKLPDYAHNRLLDTMRERGYSYHDINSRGIRGYATAGGGFVRGPDRPPQRYFTAEEMQRFETTRGKIGKENPSAGDVHVDSPMGSKRKKKQDGASADDEADGQDCYAQKFETSGGIVKVDAGLGLVIGYGIICNIDGQPYYDLQDDHIPEDAMLKAATDFMQESRVSGDMHARADDGTPIPDGQVVFAFPLTGDIAKALGITAKQTGLLVAIKPSADILGKYQSGEYTGFSIGGHRIKDETVD